jgi:hypothetical protein
MKPAVGQIVHFHPAHGVTHAAIIAYVESDTCVNLAVFNGNGCSYDMTSVQLVEPGAAKPEFGAYAEQMPHQAGQATKVDSEHGAITISPAAADALERIIMKIDEKMLEEGL